MASQTSTPLLSLRGLSASADETPILHDIDLDVGAAETHAIMGPNGAGKSTLGHVVMGDGAYTIDGGSIEFDGQDITELSPDKRSRAGLFLSFQAPVEIPGVPLSSFLRATVAGREGAGELKGKQFRKHVRALADELDMDPAYLDRELGVGFSGGEKKRTALASIFTMNPAVWTLDEPENFLDAESQEWLTGFLQALKEAGKTIIVTSHHPDIAGKVADREIRLTAEHQLG